MGWTDPVTNKKIEDNSFKDIDGKGYAHRPLVYIQPVEVGSTTCTGSFASAKPETAELFPEGSAFKPQGTTASTGPIIQPGALNAYVNMLAARAKIDIPAVPLDQAEREEAASWPKASWKKNIEDWESVFDHWMDFIIEWAKNVDEGNPVTRDYVTAIAGSNIHVGTRVRVKEEMMKNKSFGFSYLVERTALKDNQLDSQVTKNKVSFRPLNLALNY